MGAPAASARLAPRSRARRRACAHTWRAWHAMPPISMYKHHPTPQVHQPHHHPAGNRRITTNTIAGIRRTAILNKCVRLATGLDGYAHDWNVQRLDAKGCEVRLAGVKILSYCSLAEREIRKRLDRYLDRWTAVESPKGPSINDVTMSRTGGGGGCP